jgi:hypothetical protein
MTVNDDNGDFYSKLSSLRKNREIYLYQQLRNFLTEAGQLINLLKQLVELIGNIKANDNNLTTLVIFWMKSPTKGRLTHKGPYVQLKYKISSTGQWESTHLGSLLKIKRRDIKDKAGIGFVDIEPSSLDMLIDSKNIMNIIAPKINRLSKLLKIYQLRLINHSDATWESLLARTMDSISLIQVAIEADLANIKNQEVFLDEAMLKFNQAMRRRYRSFFIKWNIAPPKKTQFMGPSRPDMYIITKLSSDQRFVKTVKQFKKTLAKEGGRSESHQAQYSPWVTNRLLRVGRATVLRKRLMGIQNRMKAPLASWETSYERLLLASTNIEQF